MLIKSCPPPLPVQQAVMSLLSFVLGEEDLQASLSNSLSGIVRSHHISEAAERQKRTEGGKGRRIIVIATAEGGQERERGGARTFRMLMNG